MRKIVPVIICVALAFCVGWSMLDIQSILNGTYKEAETTAPVRRETTTESTTEVITAPSRTNISEFDILDTEPESAQNFKYNILDNGIEIFEYLGNKDIVVVPDTIIDMPVISVLPSTFRSHDNIVGISIPNTITIRDKTLFDRLDNLEIAIYNGAAHAFKNSNS